jgi:hypothetical protein
MKSSELLTIGAIGLGIYFLIRPGAQAREATASISPDFWENPNISDTWPSQSKGQDVPRITGQESVSEAVNKLNNAWNAGVQINRTSGTALKGVTATGLANSSFAGQTLKGNIATITTDLKGTTKNVFVSVKKPSDAGILSRITTSRGVGRLSGY